MKVSLKLSSQYYSPMDLLNTSLSYLIGRLSLFLECLVSGGPPWSFLKNTEKHIFVVFQYIFLIYISNFCNLISFQNVVLKYTNYYHIHFDDILNIFEVYFFLFIYEIDSFYTGIHSYQKLSFININNFLIENIK